MSGTIRPQTQSYTVERIGKLNNLRSSWTIERHHVLSHYVTHLHPAAFGVTARDCTRSEWGGRDASVTAIDPGSMSQFLVPDGTWALMAPLLQLMQRKPTDCRQPIRNRATIIGLIFVLRTGLRWEI